MNRITAIRTIQAPVDQVFQTVSDIRNFSKAIDHITNVEFLSETQKGVGTKFRETRLMNGKEASTVLEVTEFVENNRIRLISDAGGTIWDSIFTVKETNDGTELTLIMNASAYKFMARIMNPLIKGMINKALQKDMDAVKAYCEK